MCNAKRSHPMNKICVFPHKENIANAGEDETEQDSPAVVMFFLQTNALQTDESTETQDWKNFQESGKDSWFLCFRKPCHKVHTDGLKEWDKLRTNTFNLI